MIQRIPDETNSRKILVCGATGDIGAEVSRQAAQRGFVVAISGRDEAKLASLADEISAPTKQVIPMDVAVENAAELLTSMAAHAMGGIDVLINCVGVQSTIPLKALSWQEAQMIINANLTSALFLAKAFRNRRINKSNPSIIFVSSVAAIRGHGGESAYSAAKGALLSLTRSLAKELAPEGIRVNCVAPGVVSGSMTDQIQEKIGVEAFSQLLSSHPLGIGSPRDVASAIMYLASEEARWITGETLVVDGGYSST